jgi:hypothetical protein
VTARLSPFRDHVADQVMAALADAYPGPLSTPDIQVATGYGIRHGQLVYSTLTRLARNGQVARTSGPGVSPAYWARTAAPVALPPLTVTTDHDRRRKP